MNIVAVPTNDEVAVLILQIKKQTLRLSKRKAEKRRRDFTWANSQLIFDWHILEDIFGMFVQVIITDDPY